MKTMKILKYSEELEGVDITKKVKRSKIFTSFFVFLSFLLVSILLYTTIFTDRTKVVIQEFLIVDTVDLSKQDTFMMMDPLTDKAVLTYFHFMGSTHPYESTAQVLFESKRLKNNWTKERNNIGSYQTRQGYLFFPHWTDCVRFAVRWQRSHGLKKNLNFYQWLNTTPYHESDNNFYNSQVRLIELELRRRFPLKEILKRIN